LASDELLGYLQKLKGLLAHSHPNLITGELIAMMTKMALKKLDPQSKNKNHFWRRKCVLTPAHQASHIRILSTKETSAPAPT